MLIKILLVCIFIWLCAGTVYFFLNKQVLGSVDFKMNYKPDIPGWLATFAVCQVSWPFEVYNIIMGLLKKYLGSLWRKIKR